MIPHLIIDPPSLTFTQTRPGLLVLFGDLSVYPSGHSQLNACSLSRHSACGSQSCFPLAHSSSNTWHTRPGKAGEGEMSREFGGHSHRYPSSMSTHRADLSQSFSLLSAHSLTTARHTRPGTLGVGDTSAKPGRHSHRYPF